MDELLDLEKIPNVQLILDKVLKFGNHIIDEYSSPHKNPDTDRGMEYVRDLLEYMYDFHFISSQERDRLYEEDTTVALFFILERAIEQNVFVGFGNTDLTGNAESIVYAKHIYKELGRALDKPIRFFSLEQETLEVLCILMQGDITGENATIIDDYINFLGREGYIHKLEVIDAIASESIENIVLKIISKLIQAGEISDTRIINLHGQIDIRKIQDIRNATNNAVEIIMPKDNYEGGGEDYFEDDFEESFYSDNLISLLMTGASIISDITNHGGELIDYDAYKLIELALKQEIINFEISDRLLVRLESNIGNKAQVIFEIFEYTFFSNYLETMGLDAGDLESLKTHFSNMRYALNMLYLD